MIRRAASGSSWRAERSHRESLRKLELLFRLAPHLVKPTPLMMPFYMHNKRSSWTIRAGMIAYDVLSYDKSIAEVARA